MTHTFSLVREDGQWRINSPENLVLMSRASFTASFSLANLYFPATEGGDLVAILAGTRRDAWPPTCSRASSKGRVSPSCRLR